MKKILYFFFFIIFLLFSKNPAETSADLTLSGQKAVIRGTDEEEINKAVVILKELGFTEISDEMSHMSEELGLGTRKISFRYNQNPYEFRAKVMYDWFDGNIIGYMNKVLKKEKNPKRLYYMTDGYQELIIFYCSEEWAAQFMLSTGFTLDKS